MTPIDDGQQVVRVLYTNWRGETAWRRVRPVRLAFESNQWHPEPQWLLHVHDLDLDKPRTFSLHGVRAWASGDLDAGALRTLAATILQAADAVDRRDRVASPTLVPSSRDALPTLPPGDLHILDVRELPPPAVAAGDPAWSQVQADLAAYVNRVVREGIERRVGDPTVLVRSIAERTAAQLPGVSVMGIAPTPNGNGFEITYHGPIDSIERFAGAPMRTFPDDPNYTLKTPLVSVLDADDAERWRDQVETGDPWVVAALATSDLSEDLFFAGWLHGAGVAVQLLAAGLPSPGWGGVSAEDLPLLARLLDRIDGRWPEFPTDGHPWFDVLPRIQR